MHLEKRRYSYVVVMVLVLGAWVGAENLTSPNHPVLYRLAETSRWRQDCSGPCTCSPGRPLTIVGTLRLTLTSVATNLAVYAVTDVHWVVISGDRRLSLTGQGTYYVGRTGGRTTHLVLDLRTDDGVVHQYDSGRLVGGAEFPIIDTPVYAYDGTCWDTMIRVVAKPAGDFDLNGTVDQDDFQWLAYCLSGPGQAYVDAACRLADLDDDGDVDHGDFAIFQRCIGNDATVVPGCN